MNEGRNLAVPLITPFFGYPPHIILAFFMKVGLHINETIIFNIHDPYLLDFLLIGRRRK